MWSRIVSLVDDLNYEDEDDYESDNPLHGEDHGVSRGEELDLVRRELEKSFSNCFVDYQVQRSSSEVERRTARIRNTVTRSKS